MINYINLNKLRNGEYIQFHKQVLNYVQQVSPSDPNLQYYLAELASSCNRIEIAFYHHIDRGPSEQVKSADRNRMYVLNELKDFIEYNTTFMYNSKKVEAGTLLREVFKKMNLSLNQSYRSKSILISTLLIEFHKDPYFEALETIAAVDWIRELQKANNRFYNLHYEKHLDFEIPAKIAETYRDEVLENYQLLIEQISNLKITSKFVGKYDAVVKILNRHIEQYQILINTRESMEELDTDRLEIQLA
ncbi:DUF6261 family protein [Reichenbachiella versicolor]|uniref:DUF6261 family protein n=1 Tax=Reichenbachiella versicolor TaxID=1821036 RepID=UPI000D6E52C9|nr:DUF6261 family protein [Reichenbachiella versicolor]